jgi:hypothetical protein
MARSRFFVAPKVAVVRYPPSTPVGRRSALVCVLLGSRVAPVQIRCSCLALVWVLLGSHVAPAQIPRGTMHIPHTYFEALVWLSLGAARLPLGCCVVPVRPPRGYQAHTTHMLEFLVWLSFGVTMSPLPTNYVHKYQPASCDRGVSVDQLVAGDRKERIG